MRRTAFLGLLAGFISVPGLAYAQIAPPGNSAIDEYVESVPSATGNRPTSPAGGDRGRRDGAGVLSAERRRALEAQGADGRRVIEQIETGAAPQRREDSVSTSTGKPFAGGDSGGESPISAVVEAATGDSGSSGLGPVLPIVLVSTLALFAAAALLRRRTG